MTRANEANEAALLEFVRSRMVGDPSVSIGPETELFAEKVIDSMNVLRFIGYLEKKLGRRLTDDELVMENFRSVRTICERFLKETEDDGSAG